MTRLLFFGRRTRHRRLTGGTPLTYQLWCLTRQVPCSRWQSFLQSWHRSYMSGNRNILKLHERGIFQNVFPGEQTPDLRRSLIGSSQCIYCGFDPTADSLHVGNLMAIMALLHAQRGGHQPVIVLGGATAQIGDPSGKSKERTPLDLTSVENNLESIQKSIERIFTNHGNLFNTKNKSLSPPRILDNREWYAERNVIEFLSSVGRHFRMGQLLGRHSVQSRLQGAEGMSLTEFTYQIFQSYDWLHLYKNFNCSIQIGGNDQMGNMVAGHDLISRITNSPVFGLTVPLVTTKTGDKLGKTDGNAVWLNSDKTSSFDLYQFYMRQPDSEVEQYLKLFTFLTDTEITELMKAHKMKPEAWKAQKRLAEEVTKLVHGESGLATARRCTQLLYHNSTDALVQMSQAELQELFQSAPFTELILEPGTTILDMVIRAKCFNRTVDAERIIKQGGLSVNQCRVTEPEYVLIPGQHILPNRISLVRVGKKNYHIIKWLG